MRYATYTLRIECEDVQQDEDLDWLQENLSRLISEEEALLSAALPEGFYAKVDEASPDSHLGPAVRPMETYGGGA